jgi:Flp pilus assembly pilin Flp
MQSCAAMSPMDFGTCDQHWAARVDPLELGRPTNPRPPNGDCVMKKLMCLVKNTRGGDFIEYIMICGLVALVAISAFQTFGQDIINKVNDEGGKVSGIQD